MGEGDAEFLLRVPFWIDTDGYTHRDREMFVYGFEFALIVRDVEAGVAISRPIHRENESRVRMLCGKFRRPVKIVPHAGYSGCEAWSDVFIEEISGKGVD